MHELAAHCEVGTALLLDEHFTESWRQRTFMKAVTGRFLNDAIERGECVHLREAGAPHFSGRTQLYVDEPPPDLVKYCSHAIVDQKLVLPTGKLRFVGICALVKDGGLTPPEEEFLTLQLAPGVWRVDVWSFFSHQDRLENPEQLLPGEARLEGELPPTRWTKTLEWMANGLALLSLAAVVGFFVFWRMESSPYVAPALVASWGIRSILYRVSGEQARERHNHEVFTKYLATLPEVPEWIVVLRRSADRA